MGILRTIYGIEERLGAGTADYMDKLGEQVRGFACQLWRDFPDQLSSNVAIGNAFMRGYMSRVCSDGALPQAPTLPFTGGQCVGVSYDVTIKNDVYNISNCLKVIDNSVTVTVTGPVVGMKPVIITPAQTTTSCNGLSNDPVDLVNWVLESASPDQVIVTNAYVDPTDTANPPLSSSVITNVVRTDGQPDTCGNPPIGYPATAPDPGTDYVTNIAINIEDGGTLNYNVVYNPAPVSFPLNFDVGGIEVVFDLGGINFYYSLVSLNGTPIPLPDGNLAPLPAPGDDEKRTVGTKEPPPPNDTDYDKEEKTETDPKEENIGEEIEFVRVELTTIPSNAKNQFGDGAPNIYYAGWFEFQSEGYNFPRQPIHFVDNVFRKPPGATGYAYTLYNGFLGKATIYKLKQEA